MNTTDKKSLLDWYRHNRRDLPFRINKDPYRIWISEIMAQQTRIEAMLDHYSAFMKQFPDIETLAHADEDALMKAWQGLGYYSRARSLRKAAQVCVDQYESKLPGTRDELLKLPGIGPYTAGAIASIAYNERVAAVDGNVIRVYARFYDLHDDFFDLKNRKKLEKMVEDDLPGTDDISDWNQALMELGARICTPKIARCEDCPLASFCASSTKAHPEELPIKRKKAERRKEEKHVYVWYAISENHEILLHIRQRPKNGLLAGLYEFDDALPEKVYETQNLGEHHHVFSHVEWMMEGTLVHTEAGKGFVPVSRIDQAHSIPSAFMPFYQRAIAQIVPLEHENCGESLFRMDTAQDD